MRKAFSLAKFTFDYYIKQVADTLSLEYVNLDSTTAQGKLDGATDLVIAKIGMFEEAPRNPMWTGEIFIGAKVVEDTNGYRMTELLQSLSDRFAFDETLKVKDYDADVNGPEEGFIVITSSPVIGADYEGIAFVQGIALRFRAIIDEN